MATSGTAGANEFLVPHKNPSQKTKDIPITSLLGYFASVSDLIADGEYQETTKLLSDLEKIEIPPNVKFLVGRFSSLMTELNLEFNESESEISKAKYFIQENDLEQAEVGLKAATERIDSISVNLSEIQRSSQILIDFANTTDILVQTELDSLSDPIETLEKASVRLEESLLALDGLNKEFRSTVNSLQAFTSPSVSLPTEFQVKNAPIYEINLSIDSPSEAQPGRSMLIRGRLISDSNTEVESVKLKFFLGDYHLGEYIAGSNFEYNFLVPEATLDGTTSLLTEFPAQGLFEKTSQRNDIQIRRASPIVVAKISQLSWVPPMVRIAGTVESELGELPEPEIRLRYQGEEITIIADRKGKFSARLPTSYLSLLFAREPLFVSVSPSQPWFENLETSVEMNSLGINRIWIIALGLLYLFCLFGFKRLRRRKISRHDSNFGVDSIETLDGNLGLDQIPAFSSGFSLSSSQFQIVSIYQKAAQFLGSQKGISILPSTTLRDFLTSIGYEVESAFEELTLLTEKALYGKINPLEEEVRLADHLFNQIKGDPEIVS